MKLQNKIAVLLAAVILALALAVAWPHLAKAYQNTACYFQQGGAKFVAASGCEWEMQSGSTLDIQSGVTETHANNVTFSGTVTISGVALSGPTTFGTATSVTTGTTIAHSLGTTPTVVLLTPQSSVAYTSTVFVLATDATSITVGIEGAGVTVPTINWMAGK